jgi:salicylate hydroxylase
VLGLVGLADKIKDETCPLEALIEMDDQGNNLASSQLPKSWESKHGRPATGIMRTKMNLMLRDNVVTDHGVEVRYGWELASIREDEEAVHATFTNGATVVGDLLVGCDGIKSRTRVALRRGAVQEASPHFTGLSQVWAQVSHPC